jgi:transposase-like protein
MRWSPDFKFKLEAVKLVKEGGVSVAQAVRDLEIRG